MKDKQTILKESKRDSMWAEIREYENHLNKVIFTGQFSSSDFLLFYSCLQLTMIDIELYEDYYMRNRPKKGNGIIDEIVNIFKSNDMDILKDVFDGIPSLNKIASADCTVEERQLLLENIRIDIWAKLVDQKDKIKSIFDSFPVLSLEQIAILFQCITVVVFELLIKKIEIKILEGEI